MGTVRQYVMLLAGVGTLFLLSLLAAEGATFDCEIRNESACLANQTLLIYLNSSEAGAAPNNSHAQLANYTGAPYNWTVCCWTDAFRTLVNTCEVASTRVLGLQSTNNSHVQAGTNTSYTWSACYNVTAGSVSCEYPNTACSGGFSGVVSMASSEPGDNTTNAHVAEFDHYLRKVCCRIGGQNPPIVDHANLTPINSTTRDDLRCENGSVTDADGDDVTLHYNWLLNGTSITILNLPMDYDSDNALTHDISGFGRHGTVNGSSFAPTGGFIGGAFDFVSADENEIILPERIDFGNNSAWSIAYWFNLEAPAVQYASIGERGDDIVNVISHRQPIVTQHRIEIRGNISTTGLFVYAGDLVGSWHHLLITSNESRTITVYLNGSSLGSETVADNSLQIDNIGRPLSDTPTLGEWEGLLDEIIIFNRSLTSEEAVTLFTTNNKFLNGTELARGNRWNCSITPVDSTGLNGSTVFSNETVVFGSPPLQVTLLYPADGNATVEERTVNFNWTDADERDGDQLNYTFNLTVTPGVCSVDTTQNLIDESNFTFGELCVDQLYWWNVTACDVDGCAPVSSTFNFTIGSLLSIIFTNNNTDFGTMQVGASNTTDDYNPTPFLVENDGNVLANITIVGNSSLYSSVGLDDPAWQFRVEDNETGSINISGSQTTYIPVPSSFTHAIKQLNHTSTNDTAAIHINITVPTDEPGGTKQANVTIQAVSAE